VEKPLSIDLMLNYLRQFIIKIKQLLWKLIFALKTMKADE